MCHDCIWIKYNKSVTKKELEATDNSPNSKRLKRKSLTIINIIMYNINVIKKINNLMD